MQRINDLIDHRLSSQGLTPVEITRFIKDVLNVMEQEEKGPFARIRHRLSMLGWPENMFGEHDVDLISLYRESAQEH